MISRKLLTRVSALVNYYTHAPKFRLLNFRSHASVLAPPPQSQIQEICNLVSIPVGSLDELECSLDKSGVTLTSSVVAQVVQHCKKNSQSRRLLRFFTWSCKRLSQSLLDKDFNFAIQAFAEMKDDRAIDILLSHLSKEGRALDGQTFCDVVDVLVKLGRENDALGIFKNLEKFGCTHDKTTVTAIITALCNKGHAIRAESVLRHHSDKISGVEPCVYKSLLHGWSLKANVKEARRILQEMKSKKVMLDLHYFNTFLKCLCESNLKKNPSGLVPEALNVMMEMRSYKIMPNSISYNILLSCLGRTRRVKETLNTFEMMRKTRCDPDWVSYYLVARVLYLSGRFGKGNQVVEQMIEAGIVPPPKFYHNLVGVLCGVERANYALELFEHMKRTSVGEYGPVYDLLIQKFCVGGDFVQGKDLLDEAEKLGISLCCSRDVLDPSITAVYVCKRPVDQGLLVRDVEVGILTKAVESPEKIIQKRKMHVRKMKKRMSFKKKKTIMKKKKKT